MTSNLVRCHRCNGKGHVFKMGAGYTQTDVGGKKVKCPMCVGAGKHEPLHEAHGKMKEEKDKAAEKEKGADKVKHADNQISITEEIEKQINKEESEVKSKRGRPRKITQEIDSNAGEKI